MESPAVARLLAGLASLRSLGVVGWDGVEMALIEHGPDGVPQFSRADVPCVQFSHGLTLRTAAHSVTFDESMTPAYDYCLDIRDASAPRARGPFDGIHRRREVPELPTGTLTAARVGLVDGWPIEVHLVIADSPVVLVAGEVYEHRGGEVTLSWGDESVLAFIEPSAIAGMPWRPARGGLQYVDAYADNGP